MIKRLLPILIFLPLMIPAALQAQTVDQNDHSMEVKDNEGRNVMSIYREGPDDGSFLLEIGGFRINLESYGNTPPASGRSYPKYNHRPRISFGSVQVGFIGLKNPKYTKYPGGTPKFMELDNSKSVYFAFDIMGIIPLSRDGTVWFSSGLRPRWDNYSLAGRYTLHRQDGLLMPEIVPDDMHKFKKTKLMTFAIDVPVMIEFKVWRRVSFAAGCYGGLVLHQRVKTKFPKDKDTGDFGVNFFHAGATAQIKIGFMGAFFNYGFTPLFKNEAGPKTQPFSFGFVFF